MSQSVVVRVATLVFAAGGLTALVLHGCSKPEPHNANPAAVASAPVTNAPATNAPATKAPVANAEPEEDNPPFLGATKAAMPMPPKKKNPPPTQQAK